MPLIIDCRTVAEDIYLLVEWSLEILAMSFQIVVTCTSSSGVIEVLAFVVMGVIAKFNGGRLEGFSW